MSHFRRQRTEFKDSEVVQNVPKSVTFSLYSPEEIKSLSVCHVTQPESFNALFHPANGGLYDLRMGPMQRSLRPPAAGCMRALKDLPCVSWHTDSDLISSGDLK